MTEGDEKASGALRARPLLPIESDRRLAREVAEIAGRHYPAAWIRQSNERSELLVTSAFPREGVTAAVLFPAASLLWGNGLWVSLVVDAVAPLVLVAWLRKSGAGYYAERGRGLVCLGGGTEGDGRDADIVHELGHRMQDVVPGLVEREREFLEQKMGRTVRSYPPMIAAWGRLLRGLGEAGLLPGARGDAGSHGFYHPYAAFDPLDGRAFEVFTMGYQGLLYRGPRTRERASTIPG